MTRSRTSLRTRLVVAMLLVASSVLALSFVATYGLVRRSLQQHALTNLRTRAFALPGILGDLGVGTPGRPFSPPVHCASGLNSMKKKTSAIATVIMAK